MFGDCSPGAKAAPSGYYWQGGTSLKAVESAQGAVLG